jgi:hypothetical protein
MRDALRNVVVAACVIYGAGYKDSVRVTTLMHGDRVAGSLTYGTKFSTSLSSAAATGSDVFTAGCRAGSRLLR